ncbi:hypothetical protein HanXRQr2_Chr14g0667001 [Helianthus annuus]|uniref:Uncharacterized protein n=1 Tax=Helianthus annuus TaxID=4232 RepID=A0A9K3H8L4_HELAN|nr:hypothetical protein HanXRQr2_Chr14g0667001 [Helianthus annuus]KAJ0842294.1 hypothetical protein HanPSC8_Chr14g0640041 [Helianthus annuus]
MTTFLQETTQISRQCNIRVRRSFPQTPMQCLGYQRSHISWAT